MSVTDSDTERIRDRLGRDPTPAEAALFENLWSEHCAYRSSRHLLSKLESDAEDVIVGPGDDAAVVQIDDETYLTVAIESHNHPSYVDPYNGAATGVGGIVRDTLSMGAYPIALADALYFPTFENDRTKFMLDGVVRGISDYGNSIGVPTVCGETSFHPQYRGNTVVNVACLGLLSPERLLTATATRAGNSLLLVGNATGRDGLGGASFSSENLSEDAETADRGAVQTGDPYVEKLLIETNERLVEKDLVQSARDLGAAGLAGATSELVDKGGFGAHIDLDAVHLRQPGLSGLEILLSESQERMCYEVKPSDVPAVEAIAARFGLGCSEIGTITDSDRYVCTSAGERIVDLPISFLVNGAPRADHRIATASIVERSLPNPLLSDAFESVLVSPNTASKDWVYRQFDYEVGLRTMVGPGDDAAVLTLRDPDVAVAFSIGGHPSWSVFHAYKGTRATVLENATNLATKGATPIAAVDCLNAGSPESPSVYRDFAGLVSGLADMCKSLDIPVVGGNVSLYTGSPSGPIPPTPTVAMVGTGPNRVPPPLSFQGSGTVLAINDLVMAGGDAGLGGSVFLAEHGGTDHFPKLPDAPQEFVNALAMVARAEETLALHDVSVGGLATTLAEMITPSVGVSVQLLAQSNHAAVLFHEQPGRAIVETTDPDSVRQMFDSLAPVTELGSTDKSGRLVVTTAGETLEYTATKIRAMRDVLP